MDDPLGMGIFQPLGHLADDRGRFRHAERPVAADQLPQVGARHVFGDQKVDVSILTGVQGHDQLGMMEA